MTVQQANQQGGKSTAPGRVQLCLDLPVPEAMRAVGMQDGSRRPQVFHRTPDGVGMTKRMPADEAWAVGRCVQHHSDTSWTGVYLDIDLPDAGARVLEAADDHRVPPPNVLAVRRRNGHAAAAWFLQEPVHKYPGARDAPQKLYRRTVEYYRHVLGGDPAYNGVTFRNALVAGRHRQDWAVEHPATSGYNLAGGLAEYIAPYWRVPRVPTTPEGRHVVLFRVLMKRAGPEYVTDDDIRALAYGWSEAQPTPLPPREVHHIIRHVLRYRDQWRTRPEGYHRADFLERQAERGRIRAAQRWGGLQERREKVAELREAGWSIRSIAEALGTSKDAVFRDTRKLDCGKVSR